MKITTYEALEQYLKAFQYGHMTFIVIRSRGGLGKTTAARQLLPNALVFQGHATPLSIYLSCAKQPNSHVVFDDVDTLLENKTNVALLKQLCEIREDKPVHYATTYKASGEEIPASFSSNNKVLLLCNDIKKVSANLGALFTRGFYLDFEPSNTEVLHQLEKFATEKDILTYLKDHQKELQLDFRLYEKCVEVKDSTRHTGLSWKEWLTNEHRLNHDEEIARSLAKDVKLSREQRYDAYYKQTGKGARSYHRVIARLKDEGRF